MDEQILSVAEFIAVVNQTLEFAYPEVRVRGEVTGLSAKDWYANFSIKDEESVLRCFNSGKLSAEIEDGMSVVITGFPKIHEKYGFTLNVRNITPSGEGAIQRAFALLKAKLEGEGLFEPARKRALPLLPMRIGVVSSQAAAGFGDFVSIINQRWAGVTVSLANVQVQGEPAPAQIVRAIEYFNQLTPLPDVLVVLRGGGSLEDLQPFNTEHVVRAVAASRVPTMVGVGHEVDVTLADLAADVRAATPTDAARRIVPDRRDFIRQLDNYQSGLVASARGLVQAQRLEVEHTSHQLLQFLQVPQARLTELKQALLLAMDGLNQRSSEKLSGLLRIIKNADPRLLLERGYAIARKGNTIIRSSRDVKINDAVMIQLAHGSLNTEVKDVKSS